jgi:gliding motility-associated-like protein
MTRIKPVVAIFICILFCFNIGTAYAQAPNISYVSPQNYTVNQAISGLVPTNTGGTVPANAYGQVTTFAGNGAAAAINNAIRKISITGYTINKPLPPGLTFDPTTGIISGTPTAISSSTNYTVTAYNAEGSSSTIVNITVTNNAVALPAPPNISYQTPQSYNVSQTITPLTPANTGGAVPANIYGQVSTFAGSGVSGNVNATGTAAGFAAPVGLAFDAPGNLYVSELGNNDIRKITPAGVVSTFAITSVFPGGGLIINNFVSLYQLAFDGTGNLYAADEGGECIWKITAVGVISAYAGTGIQGTLDGSAANATFNNPVGIAIDPGGNMYVADRGDNTIRKIDPKGQVTTFVTVGGTAAPANDVSGLYYLATDATSNLYFGNSNQVEMSTPAAAINVIAGNTTAGFADGNGTSASFDGLVGIAVAGSGIKYVGDVVNNRIRQINVAGIVSTLAGNGARGSNNGLSGSANFFSPYGVTVDPTGNFLYVADMGNNLIRKVAITGYTIDKSLPNGLTFDPTTGIISGTPSFASPTETYTITAYNTGGSSSAMVTIQILDEETIAFDPIPPKTACDADFNPGATGSGPVTYTSQTPAVATIVSGNIHITGPGTSVITATDGTSTATQTLTVNPAVTPTISITPQMPDTCQGKIMVFAAQITNGGSSPAVQWQVNGQNVGSGSQEFSTSTLNNGDEINCTLTSNAPCTTANMVTSNTAVFTADPFISTSVKIVAGETGMVCEGTPLTFTAIAYSPDVNPAYQWQVNGINAGTNHATFTSSTLAAGDTVTCTTVSTGKCLIDAQTTSNAIIIAFSPQSLCVISIPNTFTPNGDGINDLWDINALQGYPGCTVSIYSRYGSLVYHSINYPKAWDGTYNGQKLPVGTYYYIIDLKNGKKPLSGFVTIVR